jgi:hypothetical protein
MDANGLNPARRHADGRDLCLTIRGANHGKLCRCRKGQNHLFGVTRVGGFYHHLSAWRHREPWLRTCPRPLSCSTSSRLLVTPSSATTNAPVRANPCGLSPGPQTGRARTRHHEAWTARGQGHASRRIQETSPVDGISTNRSSLHSTTVRPDERKPLTASRTRVRTSS